MNKVIEMFQANHLQLQEYKFNKQPRTTEYARLEAYFQRVLHAHSKLFDYVEDIFSQGYADCFIMPALKKAINMKTVRKVPLYKYLHSHAHEGMCSQLLNCRAMLLDTQKLIKFCVKGRVAGGVTVSKNIPAVFALDYAKLCFKRQSFLFNKYSMSNFMHYI